MKPEIKVLKLRNDTFERLHGLPIEKLRIKTSNLTYVEPLTFQHFRNLTTLDMSETTGITIAEFYPALYGLKSTKLKTLKLSHLIKAHIDPELVILDDTYQANFDLPYLTDLQIDNTKIFAFLDRGIHLSKLGEFRKIKYQFQFPFTEAY